MICGFLIDVEDPSKLHRSVRLFKEEVIPNVAATEGAPQRPRLERTIGS
jgi:hypothetical protein